MHKPVFDSSQACWVNELVKEAKAMQKSNHDPLERQLIEYDQSPNVKVKEQYGLLQLVWTVVVSHKQFKFLIELHTVNVIHFMKVV